jgi:ketol-acid reductoisomerase
MPKEVPYKTYDMPSIAGPSGPVETIAVIGYGNQGRPQALNLRDSGLPVTVGLRKGSPSRVRAAADGFRVVDTIDAARTASAIFILTPDEIIHEVAADVMNNARDGSILVLAHGVSVHFDRWKPRAGLDCGLIAPHGPGLDLRISYEKGSGLPAILAIQQDATGRCRQRIELLAAALGCARPGAGVIWSTVGVEVETDLFVEQTLLVGGIVELLRAVVATLVHAGYDPAIARMSTIYELPHLADLIQRLGPIDAFKAISFTAAFGASTRGPRLIDQHTRHVLDDILEEIKTGLFQDEVFSPDAPLIVRKYTDQLENSHLAEADALFHPSPEHQPATEELFDPDRDL